MSHLNFLSNNPGFNFTPAKTKLSLHFTAPNSELGVFIGRFLISNRFPIAVTFSNVLISFSKLTTSFAFGMDTYLLSSICLGKC